jgi:hypothetical protein
MKKKAVKSKSKKGFSILGEDGSSNEDDEHLPKDEAGRLKIKRQYEDLLGIRIGKLAGRILNRERIDKTVEGIYFICVSCQKVCHNLDEGLVEDPDNTRNVCVPCSSGGGREGKGRAG